MPTGYTYKVESGECTTLREFALTCARAMGALIMMRDDPMDAEIPRKFEPDTTYYDEQIEEATNELKTLRAMSPEDARLAVELINEKTSKSREEYRLKNETVRKRYLDMIDKVKAWEGAPEGLKDFMLSQLCDSLEWDAPEDWDRYLADEITDPDKWLIEEIKDTEWNLQHYTEQRDNEIARTAARNEWLETLFTSLENNSK